MRLNLVYIFTYRLFSRMIVAHSSQSGMDSVFNFIGIEQHRHLYFIEYIKQELCHLERCAVNPFDYSLNWCDDNGISNSKKWIEWFGIQSFDKNKNKNRMSLKRTTEWIVKESKISGVYLSKKVMVPSFNQFEMEFIRYT